MLDEAFAAFYVLRESPPIESSEQSELDGNHAIVAREGRRPGLTLKRDGRDGTLALPFNSRGMLRGSIDALGRMTTGIL